MTTDYRLGKWVIRPQHAHIEHGDEVVHVKPKSMAVLECLLRAGGEVVTRDQLFDTVWPGGVVSDATLTQCVLELRRAFGDSAQDPRVIKTIPKIGFCLIPPIEELSADQEIPEGRDERKKERVSKRFVMFGAVFAVAALAVAAWWHQRAAGVSVPDYRVLDTANLSIAVLPFVNMSEEPDNEYFADGLSEELQNLLARISQLKVAARTSSFSFRDKDLTIAEIAGALNVAHVLEGSVRKSGDRIRITVQLIEAASGFELWSERYDRRLDDIFAVQDEVAAAVVHALRLNLMGEPPRLYETNAEIYSVYLQALYFLNQETRDGRARAVEKLEEVLAIDPNYSPAIGRLAATYMIQSNAAERPFHAGFESARDTALEALAIDPDLGQAEGTLAYVESYYDWDWQSAGRRIEAMLALEPETANSKNVAAQYYAMLGRFERSLELRDEAIQLDPLAAYLRTDRAFTLLSVGRFDEAERTVREIFEIQPGSQGAHWLHAKIQLLRGDAGDALRILESLQNLGHKEKGLLAMALHGAGRPHESRAALDSLPPDSFGGSSYHRALYHAWTGERELVFEYLEQAVRKKYRVLAYVLGEPLLYPVHDDPRWTAILEQIGLLPYWLEVPAEFGGPARP